MQGLISFRRRMKFALLGYSRESLPLVRGVAREGHEIFAAYEAASGKDQLRTFLPDLHILGGWENLLGEHRVDAVLVAGPWLPDALPADIREQRDDQLRKLIQAGMPLLVVPPICEAIVGFELEMIRKDVGGVVVPAMPLALHAAWDDLADWLSAKGTSSIGRVEIVTLERFLPVRQRSDVLVAFLHDIDLLRRLVGPLKRITASGGVRHAEEKPSLGDLSVHAESEAYYPVRWSVQPAIDFHGARVTVLGETGRVTLEIPADGSSWKLQGPGVERTYEPLDEPTALVDELQAAMYARAEPAITWYDACRAAEAMEAIDRSLARGRAVDLYNEEHSEESSFKGIMAAGGCLMLLAILGAFLVAAMGAAIFPPGEGRGPQVWGWLQVCLVAPVMLFLLAQLLSFGLAAHRRRKLGVASLADQANRSD
jgi:predicted dehydrogenase